MDGEIKKADDRFNERKNSAGIYDQEISTEDTSRRVFSGLDLDWEEIVAFHDRSVQLAIEAVEAGVPLGNIVGGLAVDGLMIGILLEKARHGE